MVALPPTSGYALAALARASLPLPLPGTAVATRPPTAEPVVFSSVPMDVLSDLAAAALQQLATLLPLIDSAVQDGSAAALGRLATATATAARQIADGHAALLADGPDRLAAALTGSATITAAEPKPSLRTLLSGQHTEAGEQPGPALACGSHPHPARHRPRARPRRAATSSGGLDRATGR